MEHIILRKSDATVVNNTFRWNNEVLQDAKEITIGRVTVFVSKFKKHITLASSALQNERVRYGNSIPNSVVRYLQPDNIESLTLVTQEAQAGLTREDILALQPVVFIDWSDETKIQTWQNQPLQDDAQLSFIMGQVTPPMIMYGTYYAHLYSSIGLAKAMRSVGNWFSVTDGSTPNAAEPTPNCTLTFMLRTYENTTHWRKLVMSHLFKTGHRNNLFCFEDESGTVTDTTMLCPGNSDFIVQICRSQDNFDWTIYNLTADTVQTEQTVRGNATGTTAYSFSYSTAQTGFVFTKIGHTVILPTTASSAVDTVKTWMVEEYSGVQGSAEVTSEVVRIQDNQSNKVSLGTRRGTNFDLTFRSDDVAFEPEDFAVHLSVNY